MVILVNKQVAETSSTASLPTLMTSMHSLVRNGSVWEWDNTKQVIELNIVIVDALK